jgi:aspartate aminotransferase/aminotransferase
MTGWRLGYATAPAEVIEPMRVLQEHTVSCVAEPTQVAGLAALDHRELVDGIHDAFARRRELVLDRMAGIDGVDPGEPTGAFYVFADVSDVTTDSHAFVDHLLETARVGAIPGAVFGDAGEGFVRFSYATDEATIETAMDGLATAVAEWG